MLQYAEINENQGAPAYLNGMPAADVKSELEKVLRSRVFVHSHRIRRFLKFVVEECLSGQQHRLKEYLIGLEVFNRAEAFDPRVDSIVRVEARRLRAKLEEYYQTEGREDEIRIELRKGSYVPLFEARRNQIDGQTQPVPPCQRGSVAIGRLTCSHPQSPEFLSEVNRRIAHLIISDGCCQLVAGYDPAANGHHANGDGPTSSAVRPDFLVEGSIERRDAEVHVTLQLLSLHNQSYLWSASCDLNALPSLAGSFNRALVTSWGHSESGKLRRYRSGQGFDAYVHGRHQWKGGSPDAFRASSALFTKAVEKDSTYAAAWAALAESLLVGSLFGYHDPVEAATKIRDAAQKAKDLNDHLPEARVALGAALSIFDWDWQAGEQEFQHAIRLDGRDPSVHLAYALQLAARGDLKAATIETERALHLDPASLITNFLCGWLFGVNKKYDQAIQQHMLVSQLAPDFPLAYLGLGWAHAGKGLFHDAVAYFTNAGNLLKCRTLLSGCLGYSYARLGNRDEAMRQLACLASQPPTQYTSPVSMAAIHSGLGEYDRAFSCLEQAATAHDASLPLQLLNPEFEGLRDKAGYVRLMEKIGLSRPLVS